MLATVKKGLEGSLLDYTPGIVEEEEDGVVVGDSLAEYGEKYKYFLENCSPFLHAEDVLKNDVLKPEQIDQLWRVVRNEGLSTIWAIGVFFTKLVQNSYDAGYNDFTFTAGDYFLPPLEVLHGRKEDPLRVSGQGGTAAYCYIANHVAIHIEGNTGSVGEKGKNSSFVIYGAVGRNMGKEAENSIFEVFGKVAKGNTGWRAVDCTFKTDDEESLENFVREVATYRSSRFSGPPSGNKIIFIDNGREEVVKDYES